MTEKLSVNICIQLLRRASCLHVLECVKKSLAHDRWRHISVASSTPLTEFANSAPKNLGGNQSSLSRRMETAYE